MAYGHMPLFFATAVEAQAYLDSCRESNNYTAENYQDRVAAQRCIRQAEGWSPAPLPRPSTANVPLPKKVTRKQRQTR